MVNRDKKLYVLKYKTNPEINRPVISAIYFLFKGRFLVYIGKTKDLKSRICTHKSSSISFDTFRFIECNVDQASKWERLCIRKFKPSMNNYYYEGSNHNPMYKKVVENEQVFIQRTI